jgi:hypothetical protein
MQRAHSIHENLGIISARKSPREKILPRALCGFVTDARGQRIKRVKRQA